MKLFLSVLLLAAAFAQSDCKVDVVFAQDESGSVSTSEYNGMINFVKAVINAPNVTVGASGTLFGQFAWASSVSNNLYQDLGQYTLKSQVLARASSGRKTGGGTNFGPALTRAAKMFRDRARADAKRVLIFLTDGYGAFGNDATSAINDMNNNLGVTIAAVGLGSGFNQNQLNQIATGSGSDWTFAASFADAHKLSASIFKRACDTATPVPISQPISTDLNCGKSQRSRVTQIPCGRELKVDVTQVSGTLRVYGSKSEEVPNQNSPDTTGCVVHDGKTTCSFSVAPPSTCSGSWSAYLNAIGGERNCSNSGGNGNTNTDSCPVGGCVVPCTSTSVSNGVLAGRNNDCDGTAHAATCQLACNQWFYTGMNADTRADHLYCNNGTWEGFNQKHQQPIPGVLPTCTRIPCDGVDSRPLSTDTQPLLEASYSGFRTGPNYQGGPYFVISFNISTKYWFDPVPAPPQIPTFNIDNRALTDPNTWWRSEIINNCYDRHYVGIPWNLLAPSQYNAVDFNDEPANDRLRARGKVTVIVKETFLPENNDNYQCTPGDNDRRCQLINRTNKYNLIWDVFFPKSASASNTFSVSANPYVIAALIEQCTVVQNLNAAGLPVVTATGVLFTSLQWPYRLRTVPNTYNASFISGADYWKNTLTGGLKFTIANEVDCADPGFTTQPANLASGYCNQNWRFNFGEANLEKTCSPDTKMNFKAALECQPAIGQGSDKCALHNSQYPERDYFNVDYSLDFESLCPEVVDQVDVTASLTSYETNARAKTRQAFLINQWSYWTIDVDAVTAVTIVETSLRTVKVTRKDGAVFVVYGNGAFPCWKDTIAYSGQPNNVPGDVTKVDFNLFLNQTCFNVPIDNTQYFTLTVTANLKFQGNNGQLLEQEVQLLGSGQGVATYQANFGNGNGNGNGEQPSSAFSLVSVGAFVVALAQLF